MSARRSAIVRVSGALLCLFGTSVWAREVRLDDCRGKPKIVGRILEPQGDRVYAFRIKRKAPVGSEVFYSGDGAASFSLHGCRTFRGQYLCRDVVNASLHSSDVPPTEVTCEEPGIDVYYRGPSGEWRAGHGDGSCAVKIVEYDERNQQVLGMIRGALIHQQLGIEAAFTACFNAKVSN